MKEIINGYMDLNNFRTESKNSDRVRFDSWELFKSKQNEESMFCLLRFLLPLKKIFFWIRIIETS